MFSAIPAPENLVAAAFSGSISGDDVAQYYDLLEARLAGAGRLSMAVAIDPDAHFTLGAMAQDSKRGFALFHHAEKLDRIAIAADQKWIQIARPFMALFRNIDFRMFEANDRDAALVWAAGGAEPQHTPAFRVLDSRDPNVTAFEIDGKLTDDDFPAIEALMQAMIDSDKPVNAFYRIRNFSGADFAFLTERKLPKLKLELAHRLRRFAVVGAPAWMAALISVVDPLFKAQIKAFDAADEAAAWAWLGAPD